MRGGTVHEYGLWSFFNRMDHLILILQMYTLCGALQRVSNQNELCHDDDNEQDFQALSKGRVLGGQRESQFGWT